MFDPALRTPVVYATAVRYQTTLWRVGAAVRAGCMAGLWILLLWFPRRAWPDDAALLVLGSLGVIIAWAHNRPSLLDWLATRGAPGVRRAASHLRASRGRATADLSGLVEGFGIIAAALLYGGPFAVRPLRPAVYVLGVLLITAHVWSAFLQAMTDSGWYTDDPAPGRGVLALRPLMPPLVALITFAILGYPVYWRHQPVPGGLAGAGLAAGAVVLLLPFTAVYELVLRGGAEASATQTRQAQADDAITVHSLVKNAAYTLVYQADNDPGASPETRALAREMLALTEEARLMVLRDGPRAGSTDLLWHCVTRTLPGDGHAVAVLAEDSRSVELSGTDFQLARRFLLDLVTNAWKAGATVIEVAIRVEPQPGSARTQTVLTVDDNGPGMPGGVLDNPATSLAVLAARLRDYAGSLTIKPRAGGGTRVSARWRSAW